MTFIDTSLLWYLHCQINLLCYIYCFTRATLGVLSCHLPAIVKVLFD